jgi:5-formyltetrahydrofolate cyclo-ligase
MATTESHRGDEREWLFRTKLALDAWLLGSLIVARNGNRLGVGGGITNLL